jgi:hypothetical protein
VSAVLLMPRQLSGYSNLTSIARRITCSSRFKADLFNERTSLGPQLNPDTASRLKSLAAPPDMALRPANCIGDLISSLHWKLSRNRAKCLGQSWRIFDQPHYGRFRLCARSSTTVRRNRCTCQSNANRFNEPLALHRHLATTAAAIAPLVGMPVNTASSPVGGLTMCWMSFRRLEKLQRRRGQFLAHSEFELGRVNEHFWFLCRFITSGPPTSAADHW